MKGWHKFVIIFNALLNICRVIQVTRLKGPKIIFTFYMEFEELPKTSTGKTQKFVLRDKAKVMRSISSK